MAAPRPGGARGFTLSDIVLLLAIIAISVASVSAYRIVGEANAQTVSQRLSADTTEVRTNLSRKARLTVPPTSIAGLVATVGPDQITRSSFNAFAGPLLASDTNTLASLEWAPMVPDAGRMAFEDRVRGQGAIDFAIVELGADGIALPAGQRADYFPVEFAEPFTDTSEVIGLDLGAEAIRRGAIERARDTASIVATPPITVAIGGAGVVLVVPAYAGGAAPATVDERRAAFLGVAVAIYRPNVLLEDAAGTLTREDVAVALVDLGPVDVLGVGSRGLAESDVTIAAQKQFGALAAPTAVEIVAAVLAADALDRETVADGSGDDATPAYSTYEFAGRRQAVVLLTGPSYGAALATQPLPIVLTAVAALAAVSLYAVQRRRFEGALGSAAARLRSVLSASPDAFVGLDDRGRVVDWSDQAERLFDLPRSIAIGRRIASLLEMPRAARREERPETGAIETALASLPEPGDSMVLELVALRSDGTRLPVDVTMAVSPTDARWSVACFVRDATERHRSRDELLRSRAAEAIGELTGRLAHDFNNLLGIIVGTLDLAREDLDDRPDTQRLLDMAVAAGIRGADVTKALLAVARRSALAPTDMDINDVVREVTPLLRQAVGSEIAVVLDLAPEPVMSHLDTSGLTNSLLNLAINAAHAMPTGGQLTIVTRPGPDEDCTVTVSDTGVGIAPEALAMVFEPFFTTKKGGTGLGLAIVRGFAEQSEGSATIESALGVGTTVRLQLPPSRGDVVTPIASVPSVVTGSECVVVVDDEGGLRQIAATWLKNAGYDVHMAGSGPAGLQVVLDVKPKLLVTDVIMPGEYGGLELARRARDAFPDLRIVLASGYAGVDLEGVIESGLPLLEKPYRRQALVEAARAALDSPIPLGVISVR